MKQQTRAEQLAKEIVALTQANLLSTTECISFAVEEINKYFTEKKGEAKK